MVFKYKTLIANVLVRTLVCKPTASPGSQEKMGRAGFLQLLIANVLDRTPVCKVRAAQDLCIPSTQTVVLDDPCATTYKQFGKICSCHIGYVAICQTGNIDTTLMLFYVDMRKKFESNKMQWISFHPQRWDVPYRKPSCLL